MESLQKDILEKTLSEIGPNGFVHFCAANLEHCNVKTLCGMNSFWRRRMNRDFPMFVSFYSSNLSNDAKNIYLKLFSKISKITEKLVEEIYLNIGNKQILMIGHKHKKVLYDYIFNGIVNMSADIFNSLDLSKVSKQQMRSKVIDRQDNFLKELYELLPYSERYWHEILSGRDVLYFIFKKLFKFLGINLIKS